MTRTSPRLRVEGFDGLRGLCAIAVAVYHCLMWTDVATVYSVGAYGVYIFFVLSAASMVIAYAGRLGHTVTSGRFLLLRFARLAPLYGATAVYRAVFSNVSIPLVPALLLNLSLLFGLSLTATVPLVTGGWSIGIECAFYLLFPVLLEVTSTRRGRFGLCALLAVAQAMHITVALDGHDTLLSAWEAYVHPLAFGGYFAAGMALGWSLLEDASPWRRQALAWAVAGGLVMTLGVGSASSSLLTISGLRGAALAVAAVGLVVVVARLAIPAPLRAVGSRLGEWSYGIYLLHPLIFSGLSSRHLLGSVKSSDPVAFVVVVMLATILVAAISWSVLERPLLTALKRRLAS